MSNDEPGGKQKPVDSPQDITVSQVSVATLDRPRARETRREASNRWIREGRQAEVDDFRETIRLECLAKGLARHEAVAHSWECALDQFPRPGDVATLPGDEDIAKPFRNITATPHQQTTCDSRLQGLSNVPESWGKLPANASLAADIGWVQSNRLYVVEERCNLTVVHLDRAHEPAPSRAALGWLETSIRSYAKFVDVAAKALTTATDEATDLMREDIAIEEIRTLLAEMHKD